MIHLAHIPDISNYAATFSNGVVATDVSGGLPRLRQDYIYAPRAFNLTWKFDTTEYTDFAFFFRKTLNNGAGEFLIDLILDTADAIPYVAQFVPGSVRLTDATGENRTVQAQVLAMPQESQVAIDEFIQLYSGKPSSAGAFLFSIEQLVNVHMPEALG